MHVVRPKPVYLDHVLMCYFLVNCQKACKKCDDGRPCQRCLKHNLVDTCRNSVRKERKKGMKRGPYKRKAELTSTSKDEEKDSLLAVFGSQQDSARTPLPVLPQNHIMENVTPSSVITSQSDFMSSFSQVGLGNQFQTSLASQHHYPLVYNRNGNTDIPSPISNHNDINIGITNRPSPQRHFVSHEKEHEFKNMFPLSFHDNRNNNSVSTTLQSNGVMVYGTPTGSPLLSSSSNSINNEINPSWNSLVTDGTFQYVPQHNSHAYP